LKQWVVLKCLPPVGYQYETAEDDPSKYLISENGYFNFPINLKRKLPLAQHLF
jgi:hypothetical protein